MPPRYSAPEESLSMVSDVSQMKNQKTSNNDNNDISKSKTTTSAKISAEDCGFEDATSLGHRRRRGSLLGRVMGWDQQDKKTQQQQQNAHRAFPYKLDRSGSEESLRGYRDDENTEIWDLLNQSKSRLDNATTNNTTLRQSSRVEDDDDEISLSTTASSVTNDLEDTKSLPDTSERSCNSAMKLLQKSKQRLSKISPQPGKKQQLSEECNNHVIPNEKESEEDDTLTLQEILIALEAAEEAARSGNDSFLTPATEELRKSAEQKELMFAMEAAEEAAKAGIETFKLIARR